MSCRRQRRPHNDHLEILTLLLQAGANPNEPGINNNTPLHIALLKNNKGSIEVLLQAGADINIQNSVGNTPFMLIINKFILL